MFKNPYKILLLLLNIIIISILYGDLFTSSIPIPEELDRFYLSQQTYGRTSSGGNRYEIHNYLKCKSGNIYKIGMLPDSELENGQPISIIETSFLNKVKVIELEKDEIEKSINVSFLLDPFVCFFVILTLFITIINIFFNHRLAEFGLSIFSVLIYMICFVYLNYL